MPPQGGAPGSFLSHCGSYRRNPASESEAGPDESPAPWHVARKEARLGRCWVPVWESDTPAVVCVKIV